MTRINIRLDPESDEIIDYIAKRRKVAKAAVAKDLLMKNLSQKLLEVLLEDYKMGKIGLKKVIKLTKLPPLEIMEQIAKSGIEPPITEDLDDYTKEVTDRLIEKIKESKSPQKA